MLDDSRIRKTFVSCGLLSEDDLKEVEVVAFRRGGSVYRTAIETGRVDETDAVSHLAGALGVPSVSLEKFTAKQKLLEVLPVAVVRKYRVLPVGLKPRNGDVTLFVAMEDPQDLDALEAVSQHCTHPVVPLLAGPVDLDRALDRVYPDAHGPSTAGTPAPNGTSSDSERRPDIFAQVLEDLDGAAPSDMLSALSMLDDIPRNRHDLVTAPAGFQPVRKTIRPPTDLASTVESEKSKSSLGETTHFAAPGANETSGFQRSGPASANLSVLLESGDSLGAALAKVLIVKRIITVAELEDALED